MSEFPHTIKHDDKVIARFLTESDRDIAMDALREAYPDCTFTGGEDE